VSPARRAATWWLAQVRGRDRLVLLAGLTVRVAAVAMLAYVLPLTWAHLPRPGASALLAVLLAAESLAVVAWWLARHRLDPRVLWLDLPTGVLALLAGTALVGRHGPLGWAMFVYPYMILISFAVGLTCRRLVDAVAFGALWGVTNAVGLALFHPVPVPGEVLIVPAYLVNPAVGWGLARLLRRGADEVEAARIAAVRETADLVAAAQRAAAATALHDRVLQTLETLGRGETLADVELRERVRARAAWLRRYVETGQADQSGDLSVALEAAVRAARQAGITVEVNDARLRVAEPGGLLGPAQRDVLVDAAYQTIAAFRGGGREIVVRATPEEGGVLVTVLSAGPGLPDAEDISDARSRLDAIGGRLTIDAAPYAELWVPRTG
jgi:signal transduction histidine kinase